jgi:hypothetical protein
MPILKRYHRYENKNKTSKYIAEITPTEDLVVSEKLYCDYVDTTKKAHESTIRALPDLNKL